VSAYIIFIKNKTSDAKLLEAYGAKAKAARPGHAFRPLVVYGAIETLEGDDAEGAVLLEFSSMDEARAWYFSDKYQEAKAIRQQAADYRVLLIDGIP
jgi:uncharacterized protein (DUF1330 family)